MLAYEKRLRLIYAKIPIIFNQSVRLFMKKKFERTNVYEFSVYSQLCFQRIKTISNWNILYVSISIENWIFMKLS